MHDNKPAGSQPTNNLCTVCHWHGISNPNPAIGSLLFQVSSVKLVSSVKCQKPPPSCRGSPYNLEVMYVPTHSTNALDLYMPCHAITPRSCSPPPSLSITQSVRRKFGCFRSFPSPPPSHHTTSWQTGTILFSLSLSLGGPPPPVVSILPSRPRRRIGFMYVCYESCDKNLRSSSSSSSGGGIVSKRLFGARRRARKRVYI